MFWIELIIVLAIIFIGVRVGGTFLAMAGGIGMFIMTFILHVTPSDPPITVILIMIAVICAAATMQACGAVFFGCHGRYCIAWRSECISSNTFRWKQITAYHSN